ncbi:MAG TPA: GAF domain-containing protein, partial [Methylomirabilota bacterium]
MGVRAARARGRPRSPGNGNAVRRRQPRAEGAQTVTDVPAILLAIARTAARLCEANDAHIYRVEGDHLRVMAIHGSVPTVRSVGQTIPITPRLVTGRAVLDRRTIHLRDITTAASRRRYPGLRDLQERFRTLLIVPLLREGGAIGLITIRRMRLRPFTAKQISLLRTFADQAAIALENERLRREVEARNRDLTEALEQQTATSEILRLISSSPTDVQPVLEGIVKSADKLCDASMSAMVRFDGQLMTLQVFVGASREEREAAASLFPMAPTIGTSSGRAIVERRIIHIHDVRAEPGYTATVLQRRTLGYRTVLSVPLLRDGDPIGVLVMWRRDVKPFSQKQIDLMATFADQAVIAIENVRLFTELEARNRDLTEALEQQTATSEVLKVISRSTFDLQPVLKTLVESATRLCGAQQGFIFRSSGQVFELAADYNAPPAFKEWVRDHPIRADGGRVVSRVARGKRTVQIVDAQADSDWRVGNADAPSIGDVRTLLGVPMLREEALIGVLAMWRSEVRPFTDRQIELVTTFADQAVIAIENVRLFTELQARNRDLTEALEQQTATGEILRVISSSPTDVQPVFDTIVRSAATLCEATAAGLFRFDGTQIHLGAYHNWNTEMLEGVRRAFPRPPGRGTLSARAILSGQVAHVADMAADPEFAAPSIVQAGFRTGLSVPMIRARTTIGAITVTRLEVKPFTEKQIELLKTFADQAVIAIENVRLFQELEARNRDLTESLEQQTATSEILRVISSSPTDAQPVFDIIVQNVVRLCDGVFTTVFRFDGKLIHAAAHHQSVTSEGLDVFRSVYPMRPSKDSLIARAILDGVVIHVPDVEDDPNVPPASRQLARALNYRSILTVPMLREGHPIGAIGVGRHEVAGHARPFSAREIELLKTFADQAVIAIENVRLFTELEARNHDLSEALEQQTATSEVLRAISTSPSDLRPIYRTILQSV